MGIVWQKLDDEEIREIAREWQWLQNIALFMVISNVFMPFFAALLALWVLIRRGWRAIATPINLGYFWLSVWMIFTTAIALDVGTAAGGLANFLPYFLLAATTSYIVRTPSQFIHLLWLLVLSSITVSGFGLLQALIDRPDWLVPEIFFDSYPIPLGFSPDRRIQSFFGHFNETAIYLLMILPIALHLASGRVKSIAQSQRLIAAIALGMGVCVLIMTSSRNAWGLAILGAVIMAIYYRKWQLVMGFGICTLVIAWAVFGSNFGLGGESLRAILPAGFVHRLASAIDPSLVDYASTEDRLNAWHFAISLVSQHPLQGWGLRNFPKVAEMMKFDLRGLPHEHNLFLAIAVGAGIPAMIGFVTLIAYNFKVSLTSNLIKETEGTILVVAIAILLFLMSCWLDLVIYEPRISMLLWYLLGGMYGLTKQARKNSIVS